MCSRKGVTVGRQLHLNHFHDVSQRSKWGEAKVNHPGTLLFHLPSEKGNPPMQLRVLVNRYPKWVMRGMHQTTHPGQVLPIQLELIPNSPHPWEVGLGRDTKHFRYHRTSQRGVWKSMNEQQRHSKMLKGIMKDQLHQWGLDSEENFVSPWKDDDISVRWPLIIGLATQSSVACRGARLVWRGIIAGLSHTKDACTWSSSTWRLMPWRYLKMFVSVESPEENITYLEGHCVGHFWGVLRGIVRWLVKPLSLGLYVTIVVVISTNLASVSGNTKAAVGMVIEKICGGGAVVARIKRRCWKFSQTQVRWQYTNMISKVATQLQINDKSLSLSFTPIFLTTVSCPCWASKPWPINSGWTGGPTTRPWSIGQLGSPHLQCTHRYSVFSLPGVAHY